MCKGNSRRVTKPYLTGKKNRIEIEKKSRKKKD